MNNWMLPFLVLVADEPKRNRAGALEAMLTSQMPEAPRTLLTVTREIDRADQQEQREKAVAKREEALANLIDAGKLIVSPGNDLSGDPRMLFMISKLSNPDLRKRVEDNLKPSIVADLPAATRHKS
jgi:hypothetical protein